MEKTLSDTYKDILINEVLNNPDKKFNDNTNNLLSALRRDTIDRPVIFVGKGSCGVIAGANGTYDAVKEYISARSINAELLEVGCGGFCAAEPVVEVQLPGRSRIAFQQVMADQVDHFLDQIFNNILDREKAVAQYRNQYHEPWEGIPFLDELPFFAHQKRIVLDQCGLINPERIEDYIAREGYQAFIKTIRNYTAEYLCSLVEESQLRGRGGGGFPAGKKWRSALKTASDKKYVICNADESDPGAFMDRSIMEGNPHRLIEGIAIAAYAIDASKAYIYTKAEYSLALYRLENAIQQAKEFGLLGEDIFESGFNLNIEIRKSAGAFVCGEETALISTIEGRRGMPSPKPPYPSEKGLFGKPTIVNNVETLANVPAIIHNGPQWFNRIGTETSKGTKLFSLTGKVKHTGLIEVEMGTSLQDIIDKIGGGIRNDKEVKAIHLGGPTGSTIPPQHFDTPVCFEALKKVNTLMGSGGMVILDEDSCMVDMAKFFMDFIRKESCGKCIPCREGTLRIHEILENITRRPEHESGHQTLERFKGVMQLEGLAEVIRDTSLCGLGKTAPSPVLSTMKWFRHEYEEHIFDRKCKAGVCKQLRSFYIDVDKCTGCMICAKKCPVNAIIGSEKKPHFIIDEKCIGCGICLDVCKFNAVYVK